MNSMMEKIDKRRRASLFRDRLAHAMERSGTSQSALARATGVDRSTISQLLGGSGARLPNGHVVGACGVALGVSTDWLLGLSDRPESIAELLSASTTLTEAPRALVDETIFTWHREAQGYKIRHVPATLPDMLKIRELITWEYAEHLGKTAKQAINASEDRLSWMQNSASDYEIAIPRHELAALAAGSGYYAGLDAATRRAQLDHMATLSKTLYPRLRLYLFNARRLFSAPITIFGPLNAVIYLGHYYVAFRDTERVTALTMHFDGLVREADLGARSVHDHLRRLSAQI